MRNNNIDILKGILILLVIVGHVINGSVENSFLKYSIYSFHMPLFIGISGYLLNTNKIKKLNFIKLINKYLLRTVIPWVIAVFFYFFLFEFFKGIEISFFKRLFESFILTFYHLWYIPAFLSWIIITWIQLKIGFNLYKMFLIAIFLSLSFYFLKINPDVLNKTPQLSFFTDISLITFRPYFYIFFVIGLIVKNQRIYKSTFLINLFLIIMIILNFSLYFFENELFTFIVFYFFNVALIYKTISICNFKIIKNINFFEWIGKNSLGIYLWHVFPILVANSKIFKSENFYLQYVIISVFIISFFLSYKIILKNKFLSKYFFGM